MRPTGPMTALAIGFGLLAAGPAFAVSVTNQSDKAHEITIDLGATEPTTKVDAGKSAKLDCPEGCELRVPSVSYGLAATAGEKVVIGKDGMLAYQDGAAAKDAKNETGEKAKSKTMVD